MIARLPGIISAPPTPCTMRAPIRTSVVGANPQASDPSKTATIPAINTRLRPSLSPSDPPTTISAASISK